MSFNLRSKDIRVCRNLWEHSYAPILVSLAFWCMEHEPDLIFTSGYRAGDEGVHGTVPGRGLDGRGWNLWNPKQLCEKVNEKWVYDPSRPDMKCAIYHAYCSHCKKEHRWDYSDRCTECGTYMKGEWHIHLQVHQKTKMKGEDQ